MNKNTGGSAFPARNFVVPKDLEDKHVHALGETQGMTLRDYFAAKAMNAFLSGLMARGKVFDPAKEDHNLLAESSYFLADAMLNQRDK
jgi:hypothetical protein